MCDTDQYMFESLSIWTINSLSLSFTNVTSNPSFRHYTVHHVCRPTAGLGILGNPNPGLQAGIGSRGACIRQATPMLQTSVETAADPVSRHAASPHETYTTKRPRGRLRVTTLQTMWNSLTVHSTPAHVKC